MTKKIALVVFLMVGLFMVVGVAMAQDSATTETAITATTTAEVAAPVAVGNKTCPVSGMAMAELGKDTVEYEGKVYNLCSPMCKEEFLKDPSKYVAKVDEELAKEKEAAAVPEAK